MADYQCFPIWENSSGVVGNVDPASLNISADLISRLNHWAGKFDSTLKLDDPMNSGFASEAEKLDFMNQGRDLCQALQAELGSDYSVSYD